MEFSIRSNIRDMVKLRNEKSRPILQEESEEELFGWTLSFELKQLPQCEKVIAKHELKSAMFKYQMMAIQKNMGNEIHSFHLMLATQISFLPLWHLTGINNVIRKNSE